MNFKRKLTIVFMALQFFIVNLLFSQSFSAATTPDKTTKRSEKVIVSLASYPPRYHILPYALKSLANQTVKPDKIILNLYLYENSEQDKQKIHNMLKDNNLENVITVNWITERIKSYVKLIPALKMYPDDIIITADDDWEYYPNYVADLLKKHKQFPKCIIANIASPLNANFKGEKFAKNKPLGNVGYVYTGWGILCPPHCFNNKVFDKDLFMREFPTTDDIWFAFCANVSNTKIVRVFNMNEYNGKLVKNIFKKYKLKPTVSLWSVNCGSQGNDIKNLAKVRKLYKEMNIKIE